jgi:hypothetical protein
LQIKVFDSIDKSIRKFYGLKSGKVVEHAENISNDTSTCYEDYTFNMSEDVTDMESPTCKKRKIYTERKIIQKDATEDKTMLINRDNDVTNEHKMFPQDEKENNNLIPDQQHYTNTLALTTHIEPLNLSDSDSNDGFPISISSDNKMSVIFLKYSL